MCGDVGVKTGGERASGGGVRVEGCVGDCTLVGAGEGDGRNAFFNAFSCCATMKPISKLVGISKRESGTEYLHSTGEED